MKLQLRLTTKVENKHGCATPATSTRALRRWLNAASPFHRQVIHAPTAESGPLTVYRRRMGAFDDIADGVVAAITAGDSTALGELYADDVWFGTTPMALR